MTHVIYHAEISLATSEFSKTLSTIWVWGGHNEMEQEKMSLGRKSEIFLQKIHKVEETGNYC